MNEHGIRFFPIALFSSVMGISGVGISFLLLEDIYGWRPVMSLLFTVLASIFFLVNASIFLYRLEKYPDDVKRDFQHPVKMNFFGAISISLLLLAVLFYNLSEIASLIIWVLGTLLQLYLTLTVLAKLIWTSDFKIEQFNPTWFIPIVGNIVVPLAGVYHVDQDINWIFFSIGILFSIIYMSIFIYRSFFHSAIPTMLTPTYFILLAPPGIGTVSYMKLVGQIDVFAYLLFGIAFYLGLLLLFQGKRFIQIPFTVSWWAYLFPAAAVTNATVYMYLETGKVYYHWLSFIQIAGLAVMTILLLWKTIGLIRRRKLCIKE